MQTITVIERHGENVAPIDWEHPDAKRKPELWREAEKSPEDFVFRDHYMFTARNIVEFGMYDGWPYWRPKPAFMIEGPLGVEWKYFTSYAISDGSIFRKPDAVAK